MLAAGAGLLAAAAARGGKEATGIRNGGTFRVIFQQLDHVDPALAYTLPSWALLDSVCARLMNYPDKNAPAGLRLVPEVAARYPRVSNGGKTYTFTLRRNFRFSNRERVTASSFARAIARIRELGEAAQGGSQYVADIVAVSARGYRLVITLRRPLGDFPARTTMPFFCAVPAGLPTDPEGLTSFPAAGPYYVAQYIRGRRIVLRRNPFYGGTRPRRVDRFEVDLQATSAESVLARLERGQADWGILSQTVAFDPARRLIARYGVNRSRFFVKPGLGLRAFALNSSQPLFRNNPRLRRAVSFALDRAAIRRIALGPLARRVAVPTDQYLPPSLPGYRDARIYPLERPNIGKALRLARGHRRHAKAVFYAVANNPVILAHGQLIRQNLARIGIDVEVRAFPGSALGRRLATPNEPWDIAPLGWAPDYIDPYTYVNLLLEGRFAGETNVGWFNSPRYNRLMRRAAVLRGRARYRAYGELDTQLARRAAPMVAVTYPNEPTFISARVDPRCVVLRPTLDLTAVCLKPGR